MGCTPGIYRGRQQSETWESFAHLAEMWPPASILPVPVATVMAQHLKPAKLLQWQVALALSPQLPGNVRHPLRAGRG